MSSKDLKISVIGAGSWGTAIANLLAGKGLEINIWAYEKEVAEGINSKRRNPLFMSDFVLSERIKAYSNLADTVAGADLIVMATPSHVYREILSKLNRSIDPSTIIVSATKGIENSTLMLMSGVTSEVRPNEEGENFAVLSGPTFASEVLACKPSAAVVAAVKVKIAERVRDLFHTEYFRLYTNRDIVGVQLGGSLKNIIAIASGISAGLGFGLNTQAALITRGVAEMTRLAKNMGADPQTISGLAGIGDLILTATGTLSRNRTLGERLGRGESLQQITSSVKTIAEGVNTTKAAQMLALKYQVEMPIVHELYKVLYENKPPLEGVRDLMGRELKAEFWWT